MTRPVVAGLVETQIKNEEIREGSGMDYAKELFVISIELLQRSVAIKLEGFQIARI